MDNKIIRLSSAPPGFGQTPDTLERDTFVSELPVQHTHLYYEDDEQGLYIGVWDTTDMIETAGPYVCDEFMWLLEGEVDIKNSKTGAIEKVQAGEAFVIPKGYDCQWQQRGYLRKFFVISEHPDEEVPQTPTVEGVVKLRSGPNAGDCVLYQDATGNFKAGSWYREPFESEMSSMAYSQFVYVLEGSLRLNDECDEVYDFTAGEAFFVPQGTVCSWHSSDGVRALHAAVSNRVLAVSWGSGA